MQEIWKSYVCKAKLENGKIVEYDYAADSINAYDNIKEFLKYLGKGCIYSIDGVKQIYKDTDTLHFWKKNND